MAISQILTFTISKDGTLQARPSNVNETLKISYISGLLKDQTIKDNNLTGSYEIRIIIHQENDLTGHYIFGQDYYIKGNNFVPTIHFCHLPLDGPNDCLIKKYQYASIVDSSIWNYFIAPNNNQSKNLVDTIKRIAENYKNNLFSFPEAKNYAKIQARLTEDAFVDGLPEAKISPFVFHSESKIEKYLNDDYKDKKDEVLNQKWRVLLVADEKMKSVIVSRFKELFGDDNVSCSDRTDPKNTVKNYKDNSTVLIDFVDNSKRGETVLSERKYDIVLLDYVISDTKGQIIDYGYNLLKGVINKLQSKGYNNTSPDINLPKFGPNRKTFFFFFSPYKTATYDILTVEGINLNEDVWQISVGACPINTPQLFKYNLIRFMYRRLEDAGINKLSSKVIFDELKTIYDKNTIRKNASKRYPEILNMEYTYRHMLDDVEFPIGDISKTNESVLVTNFMSEKVNMGGMLEHLAQLVHLTANGTVRQWPEMWEEYIYFKAQFQKQNDSIDRTEQDELFKKIEDYIIKLKSHES